jgi:hypothetical protein
MDTRRVLIIVAAISVLAAYAVFAAWSIMTYNDYVRWDITKHEQYGVAEWVDPHGFFDMWYGTATVWSGMGVLCAEIGLILLYRSKTARKIVDVHRMST